MRLRNDFHYLFLLITLALHVLGIMIFEMCIKDSPVLHVPLFLGGFWIAYPALKLSFGRGLLISIAITLWMQSFSFHSMGLMLGSATLLYTLLQWARHSFQETARLPFMLSSLLINFLWIILLNLFAYESTYDKKTYIGNACFSILFSSLLIALIAPFWLKIIDRLKFRLSSAHDC